MGKHKHLITINSSLQSKTESMKQEVPAYTTTTTVNSARDVKTKGPAIGESIKLVANQLLDKPSNKTGDVPILSDTRIPPKLKNQIVHKHKITTRNEDGNEPLENGHVGVAVPVTMEELETENKISESSTSNEGISTWILLSNPDNKDNITSSTEPVKVEETTKKPKPIVTKNKNKQRPQHNKPVVKRPIIGSTNKSDLVASGSAINENVYNKIKDTVLSNVQKNKNPSTQYISVPTSSTTNPSTTEMTTTKKETVTNATITTSQVVKSTSKPKKKNKNKPKITTTTTTTLAPTESDSALLPMEAKEIELEISTPATTTKKPKRTSNRKKNKTKKKKPNTSKTESDTSISDIKTNKTKSTKPAKKPNKEGPLTTQLYNYFSREVMPSVGVGVIGLASLVGLASYFFYPFSTPVRRTFEVDKKDDLYKNNGEEYASEGNGQAEEEMLGTVLAGMPSHSKQKLNPYAGQTVHNNRYPTKKDQDIRYRHVATNYEPKYNVRYPQQKTGIAHGAVYSKPVNYNPHQYETRNVYTTENKYVYDKPSTPYPAVEPVYSVPQSAPAAGYSYGSDTSNSVVYGVKPIDDSDFRPVYPFEGQHMTYPSTSMELDSNADSGDSEQNTYIENNNSDNGKIDNKFVVGNVPKELTDSVDSATPAVVPEHGPRKLHRKRRQTNYSKRSIRGSIEELLNEAKNSHKDIFISNEVYDNINYLNKFEQISHLTSSEDTVTTQPDVKDVFTVYAVSADPTIEDNLTTDLPNTVKTEIIESVSTVPLSTSEKSKPEPDTSNELDTTTKNFKVYEVFSQPTEVTELNSPLVKGESSIETTTQFKNMMTETTTDLKSETTSTMYPSPPSVTETTTEKFKDTPEIVTYPPPFQQSGFLSLLKRFIEFKYKLGLSILQTTSDNLKRYLETTVNSDGRPSN